MAKTSNGQARIPPFEPHKKSEIYILAEAVRVLQKCHKRWLFGLITISEIKTNVYEKRG